jgi:hypothetical protein
MSLNIQAFITTALKTSSPAYTLIALSYYAQDLNKWSMLLLQMAILSTKYSK